ncbi:MAG: hydroxymethylglutaryl-CoA lyase [Myxococcota bacterium]
MIRVIEVGPRDGLQNEPTTIPTEVKVAFVEQLARSGVDEVEVSAFVSPHRVPQLADAEAVFSKIDRRPGVVYSALVPNEKGMQRALRVGVDKIGVFTAASETFNQRNINASIDESFQRFDSVVAIARDRGLAVRGYVSTAFWCPYEGRVAVSSVARVIERLLELGVDEVSIGDTIGRAAPEEVRELLETVLQIAPAERLALHFHDTFGNGAENALTAWSLGVTAFDSSTGGIGGCPFAPGAPGNLATEVLVRTLRAAGVTMNVELEALELAKKIVAPYLRSAGQTPVSIY